MTKHTLSTGRPARRPHHPTLTLVMLLLSMLLIVPARAQGDEGSQTGIGVIVEGNTASATGVGSLNPLNCSTVNCQRLVDLLFPQFLAVDPATRYYTGSSGDRTALVADWEVTAANDFITFTLRDDLTWSDSTPITAYDVFYTYLATVDPAVDDDTPWQSLDWVVPIVPLDAQTLLVATEEMQCSAFHILDFHVIPVHVFEPTFTEAVSDAFSVDQSVAEQFDEWITSEEFDYRVPYNHPFNNAPTVTGGRFTYERRLATEFIRLVTADGSQGFAYLDTDSQAQQVRQFLAGEHNFIFEPPYRTRDDIRAADDVQIFEYPDDRWQYIGLNLADPTEPVSAVDEEGEPLDQGQHPVLSDPDVRRALQMTLNIEEIIEIALLGNGTALTANQPPSSWAYNPDLSPIAFDPAGAERLLEDAGWRYVNNNIRECVGCATAEDGTPLSFDILYTDSLLLAPQLPQLIERQLFQAGIRANMVSVDFATLINAIFEQRYDAYIAFWDEPYPVDPDQSELFTPAGDVVDERVNSGSYNNPQITDLMEQARTVPMCAVAERAEIYHEVQVILQEDQPYIWLFTPDIMVAARGGVANFDPRPQHPLLNIRDWIVQK